ncbi:MAG: response regulator transcription factor [Peptococcaceae bacterium]|nr:response regulator transcription factor [Peptococcaceae bacterium]
MKSILLLEDDKALCNGIAFALKDMGYPVLCCYSLAEARRALMETPIVLSILDVNLPDGSGFDLCREIRKDTAMPIIFLTANDLETDIITGLEIGGDDYITKPFSLMVLRAKVGALLRRNYGKQKQIIQIDDFTFNFDTMEFQQAGTPIELSKTEQKLLKLLVENKGKTLTRDYMIDFVWSDSGEFIDENALSVAINRLRNKIGDVSPGKYIKTVYGIGYTWAK